ncbi:MAG: FAD-binding oxidoreductase [Hyphomicrobiaceae bacterium]
MSARAELYGCTEQAACRVESSSAGVRTAGGASRPRLVELPHDSILSLGYDWSRVGDPAVRPKYPAKVYLPRSIEDIAAAVRETRQFGQTLRIRGSGHSSNDLVVEDGGAILWTKLFNALVDVDLADATVTVQAGAMLAGVDEMLGELGYGLPVLGDHQHLTAGGFASVGGVSPASHREGMFVDNVLAVEIVGWDGAVRRLARGTDALELNRILGGMGRHGIIATLTLRIVAIDKRTTVVRNRRHITFDMAKFIERSRANIESDDDVLYQHAIWDERTVLGQTVTFGQCSAYTPTRQSVWKRLRERVAFGGLHALRNLAGRLPAGLGRVANTLSGLGFLLPPRFATARNIESFTEKVVDHTVGDPVRFYAALAPMSTYGALFRELHAIATRYRDEHGCLTSISLYVVGLRSPWLAADERERHCDLLLYLGVVPEAMTSARVDALAREVDAACIRHGAFRYMHSRTSSDPAIRARIDPNARHEARIRQEASADPAAKPAANA